MIYLLFIKMSLEILKKYKIKAKKALWQNFLVNDSIVEEIANTIEVVGQNIVEVWPWYWALTEKLILQKPKSLNLVELDNDMIEILEKRIKAWDFDLEWINFNINKIDVLKYSPPARGELEGGYSVIANIPYYITSPILRHFLYDVKNKPKNMVILMQRDVWDKIIKTSPPTPLLIGEGSKKKKMRSSVLWLFVAKKAYVKEVIIVWKENFVPSPKVESSVLLFEVHDNFSDINDDIFLETIKKWFWEPRKMLMRNLTNAWYEKELIIKLFKKLWIDETVRWEDLDINKWCEIVREINW
jgi:16S rRNA (adenine1518-N6/adenine1519-N6)-dimethyltransferase